MDNYKDGCDCSSRNCSGLSLLTLEKLQRRFQREVFDRARWVDPNGEEQWFSLTLGWAIAKGLKPTQAHYFAIHMRYHTELA